MLRLVFLNPLRFDLSLGGEEDGVLELLFEFDDELSSNGQENSVRLEVNVNNESRLGLLVGLVDGEFLNLGEDDGFEGLQISVGVLEFNQSGTDLFFNLS